MTSLIFSLAHSIQAHQFPFRPSSRIIAANHIPWRRKVATYTGAARNGRKTISREVIGLVGYCRSAEQESVLGKSKVQIDAESTRKSVPRSLLENPPLMS